MLETGKVFREIKRFFGFFRHEILKDLGFIKEMEFIGITETPGIRKPVITTYRARNLEELKSRFDSVVGEDEKTIKLRVLNNKDQFVTILKAGRRVF